MATKAEPATIHGQANHLSRGDQVDTGSDWTTMREHQHQHHHHRRRREHHEQRQQQQ